MEWWWWLSLFSPRPITAAKDKWGNWVISKEYNAAMLAEALCKLEGFTYSPSDTFTGSKDTPQSAILFMSRPHN